MRVEVAAGEVAMLCRARVGVPGQDLVVSEWNACVEGVGVAVCRSECGLVWRCRRPLRSG